MFEISVRSGFKQFVNNLDKYKKVSKQERICLQDKMTMRARDAAVSEAFRVTRGVTREQLEDIITVDRRTTQFRDSRGRFTDAYSSVGVRRLRRNRTSQVLILMATGGSVEIPSDEMQQMMIPTGRYNVQQLWKIFRETVAVNASYSSDGVTVWYGIARGGKNYTVTKVNQVGYYIYERTGKYYRAQRKSGTVGGNRNSEQIAFMPSSANYRAGQYKFTEVTLDAMRQSFRSDYEQCFNENTRKLFKMRPGITGTGFGN